ncbi:unnamed protein product [Enterobius vermicularis]|uniref:MFS domain-containing protein n=1 Tax=Enterobius vermicularis TaxID=51028 RepID=A0A0N4VMB4_ENTVE|nr:unnamed protein product [Enterobius vermicularis]
MIGGPLSNLIGRRMAMFINLIFAVIAGVLFLLAYFCKCWYLLFPGRFLIGINSGISTTAGITYITELSPINLRGMLGSTHQLFVTLGILISNILSFEFIFGTHKLWWIIFAITFIPIIIQFILTFFCPESPQYTLCFKNDEEQAFKDLRKLRDKNYDVQAEIDFLKRQQSSLKDVKVVGVLELRKYEYRWSAFLACFLQFTQQFSGINAAMYYSGEIFLAAGLTGFVNTLANCGVTLANVVMTWIIDGLEDDLYSYLQFLE